MPSDWTQVKFNEAIQIIGGGTPKTSEPAYWNGLIPWLSVVDFNGVPRWVSKTEKNITQLGLEQSSTRLLNAGDIIISARGTVGALAQLSHPMAFNQSCYGIRGISNVSDTNFIFYALKFVVKGLKQLAHGGVFDTITRDTFKSIDLLLPPLGEQKQIAELFGALDERVTLFGESNNTLEAIAQAIFKSWFIDFNPVRAKMEGHVPAGMDEETAALFPDEFVETEFGLVPKGWKLGSLSDLSDLNPESWTTRKRPDRLAYIDLANAKENVISELVEYVFDEAPSRARRVLRSGDTIIGTVRPGNRSYAFICNPANNLTGSTGFAVLRPASSENAEFVYLAATRGESIEKLAHLADGGAYPAVRPELVAQLPCVIPSEIVMKTFHDVVDVLLKKVSNNQLAIQTLSEIRDSLLPKLISGKLRITGAELEAQI